MTKKIEQKIQLKFLRYLIKEKFGLSKYAVINMNNDQCLAYVMFVAQLIEQIIEQA